MNADLRSTRLVAGRELREALRRKATWIAAVIALLGSTALMIVPQLVGHASSKRHVVIVGQPSPVLIRALTATGDALGLSVRRTTAPDAATLRTDVEKGRADVGLLLPSGASAAPLIIAKDEKSQMVALVRQAIAADRTTAQLRAAGLDDAAIQRALTTSAARVELVGADHTGRTTTAVVVSLGMYVLLLLLTGQVANGVAIEKSNRVSEVLLAIVPPKSLLYGKVGAIGLTGLLPFLAGAVPVIVRLIVRGGLPPSTGAVVASSAAWLVLGAGFYLLVAGGLGALVERQEEVGSAIGALSILLIASYLIGQSAADSPLGAVMAFLPFSSPMVEPARLALGVSSPGEVVGSLAIGVVAVFVVGRIATTIYRRAVVRTGRRLHVREVLRSPS